MARPVPVHDSSPRRTGRTHAVWIGLIAVMVAVEGILVLADLGLVGGPRWRMEAYENGAFWIGLIRGWEPNYAAQPYVMFFSYAVLHGGMGHLVGNMLPFAWLGATLSVRTTWLRFLVLFAACTFGGSVGFALLGTTPSPMVGASGAIMGLVAVWIVWDARLMAEEGWPRGRIVGTVWLRIGFVFGLNVATFYFLDRFVAWETHLGGFLAGLLAGYLLAPSD